MAASLSVRTRFEVLKRDNFTCQYCGKSSPEVVLEVDHIVAVSAGGSNDEINLRTSCWDCNRGKSDKPLSEIVTGEDPHDRAVMLLERERQLREYNRVLSQVNRRVSRQLKGLKRHWGKYINGAEETGLRRLLLKFPSETITAAMDTAIRYRKTTGLAYVYAVLNRAEERGDVVSS